MKFCVVGTGRCGSTLVRNIFNLHPDLFIFKETHWIPKMYEFFGTDCGNPEQLLNIMLRTHFVTGDLVTPVNVERLKDELKSYDLLTVAEFCNIVGILCAQERGKKQWADKTPDYGSYMELIQRLWPECKFIHLVRHGIDVALSMAEHPGYKWMASAKENNWVPASFNNYYRSIPIKEMPLNDYSALWYRRFKRIVNESKQLKPGSYQEIQIETLVEKPREILKLLAEYLDLSAPDEWIEESISIINVQVLKRRIPHRRKVKLQPEEKNLLYQLGYCE